MVFKLEVNHKNKLFLLIYHESCEKKINFLEAQTQSSASFLVARACKTCELHIAYEIIILKKKKKFCLKIEENSSCDKSFF